MKRNVLIGCTGSVASIKVPELVRLVLSLQTSDLQLEVRVVATEAAGRFFNAADVPAGVPLYTDADEWAAWSGRGDPVLHVELARWADVLLIAPLDANTLAKLANGLCDNLLTCVARAWRPGRPVLVCPAMNTHMWQHPVTDTHLCTLRAWGYRVAPCVCKRLMCGDTGPGAMAELDTIVHLLLQTCAEPPPPEAGPVAPAV